MGFTVMATQRHSLSTSSQQCVKEKHMKSTFRNVNDIHLHISPIFWMGIKRLQWWWVNLHTMGPPGHNLDVSLRHVSSGDLPESRGPGIFALADPQWCVSQTSGVQNTPHFFYGYDDTVYTASFSREFMRYSFKKTDVWNAYWHNIQIHVQLLCLDSIRFVQIPPKKNIGDDDLHLQLVAPGIFKLQAFFVWEAVLLSGSKFWFEGKMWRVYWSLLIIRFTGQGWVMPHPQKEKTTTFWISIPPSYRNKMKKPLQEFQVFYGFLATRATSKDRPYLEDHPRTCKWLYSNPDL